MGIDYGRRIIQKIPGIAVVDLSAWYKNVPDFVPILVEMYRQVLDLTRFMQKLYRLYGNFRPGVLHAFNNTPGNWDEGTLVHNIYINILKPIQIGPLAEI